MKQNVKSWISVNEVISTNREYEAYLELHSGYNLKLQEARARIKRALEISEPRLAGQRKKLRETEERKRALKAMQENLEPERSA